MANRAAKTISELEGLGFAYDRTNSKQQEFYVHPTGMEIKLPSGRGLTDSAAQNALREARRKLGLSTKDNKRNPEQIRERQKREAELAAAERLLTQARAELARLRAVFEGADTFRDERAVRRAEKTVMDAERHFREMDRLMRSMPS